MSIELSRDANRLIEDIELELASIRAAMALRTLEPSQRALPAGAPEAQLPTPAVRQIGPFDLSRSGAAAGSASPDEPAEKPKPMTLQERLASLQDQE